MTQMLMKLWKDEEGATAVEYGLMVAGIAVAVMAIVFTLGDNLSGLFTDVNTEIVNA